MIPDFCLCSLAKTPRRQEFLTGLTGLTGFFPVFFILFILFILSKKFSLRLGVFA